VTFQELVDELRKAAERSSADAPICGINAETYRMWKANAGNAKSRRRWRRRGMVNTQRGVSALTGETVRYRIVFGKGKPGDSLP
jgi:hypothetical protein